MRVAEGVALGLELMVGDALVARVEAGELRVLPDFWIAECLGYLLVKVEAGGVVVIGEIVDASKFML